MSAIHDLISQIGDPRLRERLAAEWAQASQNRKFGLVFEDHLPELLPPHQARPRKGDLACRRQGALNEVWQVKSVKDGVVTCVKPKDDAQGPQPTGRDKVIDGIVEKAELVANFPGIGTRLRVEPEGDVRMILYGHYRIAYRVSSRQATLLGSRAA